MDYLSSRLPVDNELRAAEQLVCSLLGGVVSCFVMFRQRGSFSVEIHDCTYCHSTWSWHARLQITVLTSVHSDSTATSIVNVNVIGKWEGLRLRRSSLHRSSLALARERKK